MTGGEHAGNYRGQCLCGQVRYRCTALPLLTAVCYSQHCQRQGGSAFSVVVAVPSDHYEQTGKTKVFKDKGDSGKAVDRHFCSTCGSPIASIAEALPGLTLIKAGTLDEPGGFRPTIEVYCTRAVDWMPALAGVTRFASSNIAQED